MIAVGSDAEYFEVKARVRGDIATFKAVASRFEVDNVRGFSWGGFSVERVIGFSDGWSVNV